MLGRTLTRRMIVGEMLAINTTSKNPSRLALETKDTKLTTALSGLGLPLALLSGNLLLVVSTSVTDQEHLLQASVITLGSSDDESIAVGKSMSLCCGEESFESGVATSWRW
jgi:hypothetical protein